MQALNARQHTDGTLFELLCGTGAGYGMECLGAPYVWVSHGHRVRILGSSRTGRRTLLGYLLSSRLPRPSRRAEPRHSAQPDG